MDIDQFFERITAANAPGEMLESFTADRLSVKDRLAAGKALRRKIRRDVHGIFRKDTNRPDPVEILEAQNQTRAQKLVPVRFARMLASPFAFLRGSAAVMAADLAPGPVTGIFVNACGDMHVSNFGVFGSAERELIFAINDFDEVFPAPWEWDLKRLVASIVLTWPTPPWTIIMIVSILAMILFPLFFYPFSRTIWYALDLYFQPVQKREFPSEL